MPELIKVEKIDMLEYKKKEFEKKGIELGFSGRTLDNYVKTQVGYFSPSPEIGGLAIPHPIH